MRLLIAGGAALVALACPAAAQEFGCQTTAGFAVNAIEQTEDVGTSFAVRIVKPGAKPVCPKGTKDADFVVGEAGEPLWLEALASHYLVMTRSTGPQGQIVIYDLATRNNVRDVLGNDVAVDATGATYWEEIDDATPRTCKEFAEYKKDGFGAVIAAETRFDFATGTSKVTGSRRCDPVQ